MHKIKKLLSYLLAIFFHFIPRNKHLWLTGKPSSWYAGFTPPDFFDNAKYFYLYLVTKTNEKVFWVSSSNTEIELLKKYNLPFIKYGTLKSYYFILRAGYFFHHYGIDQINPILQGNSIQIDFWHGTPLKKIRYDVVPKNHLLKKPFIDRFLKIGQTEFVASTSEKLSKQIISHAFDVPLNRCLNFGYPRTDILKLSKENSLDFCQKYSIELLPYIEICSKFKKVLLYMPTWRDDDPDYFSKANIDFEKLNTKLYELGFVFFIKLHPLTKFSSVDNYSNIFQINNDVDIYPFLTFTDFLITDYSSIYFDYLLLDKEIIFIPYDFENYTKNRELYFPYDTITPGVKYNSFSDFIKMLAEVNNLNFSQERKRIRDLLIKNYNFDASEKTYNYFSTKKE